MKTAFLVCAAAGCTLWVIQFILGLMGFALDHDMADSHHGHGESHADHHGHDGAIYWVVSLFTIRSITAGLTFFGLAGLIAVARGHEPLMASVIALAAALAAMIVVTVVMRSLHKLKADGTIQINSAVGHTGTVYLRIPEKNQGLGKVTVNLQNRTVELQAASGGAQIDTGAKVVITSIIAPDTVEVLPLTI